jgi:hypothetical protein
MARNSKECGRKREIARQQKGFRLSTPAISFPLIPSYMYSVLRMNDSYFTLYQRLFWAFGLVDHHRRVGSPLSTICKYTRGHFCVKHVEVLKVLRYEKECP